MLVFTVPKNLIETFGQDYTLKMLSLPPTTTTNTSQVCFYWNCVYLLFYLYGIFPWTKCSMVIVGQIQMNRIQQIRIGLLKQNFVTVIDKNLYLFGLCQQLCCANGIGGCPNQLWKRILRKIQSCTQYTIHYYHPVCTIKMGEWVKISQF